MIVSTVHVFLALGLAAFLFYGGIAGILICTFIGAFTGLSDRNRR